MKSTGIVRRIDDLGRIVIPRTVRKEVKWREGMPIEIYVDDKGNVILHKYDLNEE